MDAYQFEGSQETFHLAHPDKNVADLNSFLTKAVKQTRPELLKSNEMIISLNRIHIKKCTIQDIKADVVNLIDKDKAVAGEEEVKASLTYANSFAISRFVNRNTSKQALDDFIKIIMLVRKYPGPLKQFIALYAPSLSGKTQLAFSLDKYAEYPLCRPADPNADLAHRPLKVCLRLPCDSSLSESQASVQTINYSPLKHLNEAVLADIFQVTKLSSESDLDKTNPEDLGCLLSVTSLSGFSSKTLGIFSSWINARMDGSESKALERRKSYSLEMEPKTPSDLIETLSILDSDKPFVVILDEYSLANLSVLEKAMRVFLRNILRECGFVVVLMGTNSSAIDLVDLMAKGSKASGSDKMPWAQVVTSVFSSLPLSQYGSVKDFFQPAINNKAITEENAGHLMNWLEEGRCLRPGVMEYFLDRLSSLNSHKTFPQALKTLFEDLHIRMTERKASSYGSLTWLRGQVECLISPKVFCPLSTRMTCELLNEHYAFLDSFNADNLPLFALIRVKGPDEALRLALRSWCVLPTSSIALLVHDLKLNFPEDTPRKEDNVFLENNNFVLQNFKNTTAPYSTAKRADGDLVYGNSGYPTLAADEMGYLALFATECPFPYVESLMKLRESPKYLDLVDRIEAHSKLGLTTRAALTLSFRSLHGAQPGSEGYGQKVPRDGKFLEILAATSFIIASHCNGFEGADFSKFLPALIAELSLKKRPPLDLSAESIDWLADHAKFKIPFVPLMEETLSDSFRSLPSIASGTLKMCLNKDEMDVHGFADCLNHDTPSYIDKSAVMWTMELKNFCSAVGYKIIRSCVGKAMKNKKNMLGQMKNPPLVHYHFLIVSKLADLDFESYKKIAADFPDIKMLYCEQLTNGGNTVIDLVDMLANARNSLATDSEKLRKADKRDVAEAIDFPTVQTVVIVIPVETLFPGDGPVEYVEPTHYECKMIKTAAEPGTKRHLGFREAKDKATKPTLRSCLLLSVLPLQHTLRMKQSLQEQTAKKNRRFN